MLSVFTLHSPVLSMSLWRVFCSIYYMVSTLHTFIISTQQIPWGFVFILTSAGFGFALPFGLPRPRFAGAWDLSSAISPATKLYCGFTTGFPLMIRTGALWGHFNLDFVSTWIQSWIKPALCFVLYYFYRIVFPKFFKNIRPVHWAQQNVKTNMQFPKSVSNIVYRCHLLWVLNIPPKYHL